MAATLKISINNPAELEEKLPKLVRSINAQKNIKREIASGTTNKHAIKSSPLNQKSPHHYMLMTQRKQILFLNWSNKTKNLNNY